MFEKYREVNTMEANGLIASASLQREFRRFRSLGGRIEINKNEIIVFPAIVPTKIAEAFAERIRNLDTTNLFEVSVKSEA